MATKNNEKMTETSKVSSNASSGGVLRVFMTGDHKVIGRSYLIFASLFGVLTWVLMACAKSAQIGDAVSLSENQLKATLLSSFGVLFLGFIPLCIGLATYVVPLQIGARSIAFPRAAAAAFWIWLASSLLLFTSYLSGGGLGGDNVRGVDLAYISLIGIILGLLLSIVCIATTIVTYRAPGMDLDKTPMFTWSMLVASVVWLVTLPVFVGHVMLLLIGHKYAHEVLEGAEIFARLEWILRFPQIAAFSIPVLGIIADIATTISERRNAFRSYVSGAIVMFGVFSIGAWAQPLNESYFKQPLYIVQTAGLLLSFLVFVSVIMLPFLKQRPKFTVHSLATILSFKFVMLSLLAGLIGVVRPLGLFSTTFSSGQSEMMLAAAFLGVFAGIVYWSPKITGRFVPQIVAYGGFLSVLTGGLLIGFGQMLHGIGVGRNIEGLIDARDTWYVLALGGSILIAFSILIFGAMVILPASKSASSKANAWGSGQSLEWLASSPPLTSNFIAEISILSAEPLLDEGDFEKPQLTSGKVV